MGPLFREVLAVGLPALGLALPEGAAGRLEQYADLLLHWNRKVNLTAVTGAAEVAELHLLDSLALLRVLGPAETLLDVGSGAGLPGIPLAIARPGLAVTCCDAVAKKVAFVKAAAAALDLPVRGVAARAGGKPEREGLPRAQVVVSRALADPARWLPLGAAYLAEGGALVAMLGRETDEAALAALGAASGLRLGRLDRFSLPRSGAARANAVFHAS
ncbi:MAG: 16S rRNA (guanine(527)-N(7))-methyltransferase RsmG [Deltaproteobacteria bacterium]|nr:16S rRNA (guanine(527)-N(7))-methyltransferase RsmG [Deltaproteobacteria bacterium]